MIIFTSWPKIYNLYQVGLLNVDGYYNSLLSFIDKAVDEGFITPAARHIIIHAQTAHELLSKLEVWKLSPPPFSNKHFSLSVDFFFFFLDEKTT